MESDQEDLKKEVLILLSKNPNGLDAIYVSQYFFQQGFSSLAPISVLSQAVVDQLVESEMKDGLIYKITEKGKLSLQS